MGAWTADMYLLSVLRRPDSWPSPFRKCKVCVRVIQLHRAKNSATCRVRIEPAARFFWHAWLSKRGPNSATISL
jgi:3-methyladenine DNA glycosylase/8-oxoguanine DNA glycosylase